MCIWGAQIGSTRGTFSFLMPVHRFFPALRVYTAVCVILRYLSRGVALSQHDLLYVMMELNIGIDRFQDGFVLVGSVAGQRYWSTFLSQDYVITAGTWTPDDQQVRNVYCLSSCYCVS